MYPSLEDQKKSPWAGLVGSVRPAQQRNTFGPYFFLLFVVVVLPYLSAQKKKIVGAKKRKKGSAKANAGKRCAICICMHRSNGCSGGGDNTGEDDHASKSR